MGARGGSVSGCQNLTQRFQVFNTAQNCTRFRVSESDTQKRVQFFFGIRIQGLGVYTDCVSVDSTDSSQGPQFKSARKRARSCEERARDLFVEFEEFLALVPRALLSLSLKILLLSLKILSLSQDSLTFFQDSLTFSLKRERGTFLLNLRNFSRLCPARFAGPSRAVSISIAWCVVQGVRCMV